VKHKEFYDLKHAYDYMAGTIVRVGGEPVYVQEVRDPNENSKFQMIYRHLDRNGSFDKIGLMDDAVDLNPVPLGMLSIDQTSLEYGARVSWMLQRTPSRRWKVGLCSQNMQPFYPYPDYNNWDFNQGYIMNSPELVRTVRGEYPSFGEAAKLAQSYPQRCIAFSRRFCVFDSSLLYKTLGSPIGDIIKGQAVLRDDYLYLSQVLNEDLNA
jgi:hypothetical protein